MSFVLFHKIRAQEGRTGPSSCDDTSGKVKDVRKVCRKVNIEKILCTIYLNGKMKTVESIPRMKEGEIKENDGEDEFNYDIFKIL
jgi:hypothetical protein